MRSIALDMNFCRRCGSAFATHEAHAYTCKNGHVIFANASPAVGIVLWNEAGQVLILERAIDPGKGRLDIPGGFCDGPETLEEALARELTEEVGLTPEQYSAPEFVLSGIDPYVFKGEELSVIAAMFRAVVKPGVTPQADDDAASAVFMDVAAIDLDKVQFPTVRAVLEHELLKGGLT